MDDLYILTYGPSTEGNCTRLRGIHDKCLAWASKHSMEFAPQKYELIHFARTRSRFNMAAVIELGNVQHAPKTEVRILGV